MKYDFFDYDSLYKALPDTFGITIYDTDTFDNKVDYIEDLNEAIFDSLVIPKITVQRNRLDTMIITVEFSNSSGLKLTGTVDYNMDTLILKYKDIGDWVVSENAYYKMYYTIINNSDKDYIFKLE